MIGLLFDPPAALKFGGFSALLVCAILVLKALRVYRVPYRDTETWLILDKEDRPPEALAQSLIAGARRESFLNFARINATFAAACFGLSFLMRAWIGA